MYFVYVLKSDRNGKNYVGFTSKDPKVRLAEHNSGTNIFTSRNGPFKLVYSEQYDNKDFAVKRERFLKSGNGRSYLKKTIPL